MESAPNVVNTDVLAEKVWGRHFVSPENVAQRVMLLRQSLADDANRPRYIETIRNKGYRLIPVVERVAAEETSTRRHGAATGSDRGGTAPLGRHRHGRKLLARRDCGATAAFAELCRSPAVRELEPRRRRCLLRNEHAGRNREPADEDPLARRVSDAAGRRCAALDPGRRTDLNVATALGGSVHYAEGRMRVNTHLIETATNRNLWSNSYEHERSDIFAIQSDIALDVAEALRIELSADERERVERLPTTIPQARDLYLKARGRRSDFHREEVLRAVADVEQAVALDPEFKERGCSTRASATATPSSSTRSTAKTIACRASMPLIEPSSWIRSSVTGSQRSRVVIGDKEKIGRAPKQLFAEPWNLNVPSGSLGSYGARLQLNVGKFGHLARATFSRTRARLDPKNALYYRSLAFVHEGLGESTRANELVCLRP